MRARFFVALAVVVYMVSFSLILAQEGFSPLERGVIYLNQGSYDKAIGEFSKEIEANPKSLSAYYNLGLAYEKKGDYFKAYIAWKKYAGLSPSRSWAKRAEERMEALKGGSKVIFEGLKFEEVKINNLFPSIYKYYSAYPVGYAKIRNRSENPITTIKLALNVKKYMDFPTEVGAIEKIEPDDVVKVDLYAGFNNQILEVTEDTPILASISASYNDGEKRAEKSRTDTFILHNRNAMTWNIQDKLASFVTAKDPAIRVFGRGVTQMYKDEEVSFIPERVQKAMLIFDALGAYGVAYIEDPVTPFREISEKADAIDYIQYPVDTIRLRTGDCDDGVVLYAAILESIGIPTALVDFPGHVYPMFNTGIAEGEANLVSTNRGLTIIHKGYVWVPVEITVWGKTFTEAWAIAADRYYRTPANQRKIIEIQEAWKTFNPVTLLETGWSPEVPPKSRVDQLVKRDVSRQHEERVSYIVKNYADLLSAPEDDYRSRNRLGIAYAKNILLEEASSEFEKALKANPDYTPARVNLGNVYYQLKRYDRAIEEYDKVLKVDPENARLLYNVGMIYYRQHKYEEASKRLEAASRLDPSYRSKFESIPMRETTERAAEGEVALPELELVWME
jgi:tetratricopeptide (TPR) repeat protein